MAKFLRLPNQPKEPWYKSIFAKIAALILFLASLFGMLNDGCSYLERWLPSGEVASQSIGQSEIEDVIVNLKPLTLTHGHFLGIIDQNAKPYTFELETTGNTIVIEDSIRVSEVQIKDRRIENTERFNIPSIELLSTEIDSKLLSKEKSKTNIKLLFKINFFTNAQIVSMSQKVVIENVGYIGLAIPYKVKNQIKWKTQNVPVLLEVLPH
jgi:hypothetical protein